MRPDIVRHLHLNSKRRPFYRGQQVYHQMSYRFIDCVLLLETLLLQWLPFPTSLLVNFLDKNYLLISKKIYCLFKKSMKYVLCCKHVHLKYPQSQKLFTKLSCGITPQNKKIYVYQDPQRSACWRPLGT